MSTTRRLALAGLLAIGCFAVSSSARAQSIIRQPNNHVTHVEVEIHGNVGAVFWGTGRGGGWGNGLGLGPGFRVGIPLMRNGFVSSINNMVALSFGADLGFWWFNNQGYWYPSLTIPVMLQWNFYFTPHWSLGAELGLAPEIWFDNNYCVNNGCWFGPLRIWPSTGVVARYHFGSGNFPTLTMRLGFPTGFAIGVSF